MAKVDGLVNTVNPQKKGVAMRNIHNLKPVTKDMPRIGVTKIIG